MDVQSGVVGTGLVPRLRRGIALAFAFLLLVFLAPAGDVGARPQPRPIDYHATVINGHIVGSAFMIDDDLAVTNAHVLRGRVPGDKVAIIASGADHMSASARVVAISSRIDLALLGVPANLMPKVMISNARPVPGLRVTSAGIDATGSSGPVPSEAAGVVTNADIDIPAFGPGLVANMPDARHGFSGGPMLDNQGRLVGMISAIRTGGPMDSAATGGAMAAESADQVEAFALRIDVIRDEVRRLLRERR